MHVRVEALSYHDEELARLALPGGTLRVTRGIGSGLSRRAGDPSGVVWAVGDRGPNLKLPLAIGRYGLDHLGVHADATGAKLMPCPDIGPAISELHVGRSRVPVRRTLPLRDAAGRALSGLPPAGTDARAAEPALRLDGTFLPPDPGGADTEGLATAPDGGFWVGEEYGPSLLHLRADGSVRARWVPAGTETLFAGATYPIVGAAAARRAPAAQPRVREADAFSRRQSAAPRLPEPARASRRPCRAAGAARPAVDAGRHDRRAARRASVPAGQAEELRPRRGARRRRSRRREDVRSRTARRRPAARAGARVGDGEALSGAA